MKSPALLLPTALVVGLGAAGVSAAPGPVLRYEAPEVCPSRSAFLAAVRARGASIGDSAPEQPKRTMVVSIQSTEGGYEGTFQIRSPEGVSGRREVHGSTCGEVVNALAVVTAIALRDEQRAAEPEVAGHAADAKTPAARESGPPPEAPEEPETRLRGHTPLFPGRHQTWQVPAGTLKLDQALSITALGGVTVGLIPSVVMPRYDLTARTATFLTGPDGEQRLLALAGLRVGATGIGRYRTADTTTDIRGLSFGMGGCLSPTYDSLGWVVLVCGEYGGGILALDTSGPGAASEETEIVGYALVDLGAEVEYHLGSLFHVALAIGGEGNISQVKATRADGSTIFESGLGAFRASAGLGLHF